MKAGILFDCDGVLIDSPVIHARAWAWMFRGLGIEIPLERFHLLEGNKSKDIAYTIMAEYGLEIQGDVLDGLIEEKRAYYREHSPDRMRPDARIAVEELKKLGWIIGLVSGSILKNVMSVLKEDDLQWFDGLFTAENCSVGKPDPEPYLNACRHLDLIPERSVAVENAPLGIISAKKAGLRVIALTSTLPESELRGADAIISDLTVLPTLLGTVFANLKR